jgi:hypothetical protein
MKTSDITLVFQGAFKPYVTREHDSFARNIKMSREVLPAAKAILSTWEGAELPPRLELDDVVLSHDPGGLAPLKLDDDKINNVNRQLVTTRAGLAAVTTPYAAKIRTDCSLKHAGFLDFHAEQLKRDKGRERLIACSFFTLDPTVFERLPYHVSDWFHFGPTELLREYWAAEPLSSDNARFYESHEHTADATFFERKFRARFAVEQHICMQFAQSRGYACPGYLNDVSDPVMHDYHAFLAREVMLLDPWQIGLLFNKYDWVGDSPFQRMNNLMHLDWIAIADPQLAGHSDAGQLRALIQQRARKKQAMRLAFRYTSFLHSVLFDPARNRHPVRRVASRIARYL